ncbi:MAG: tRNA pseudouridine(55) synthase TruB [Planctomycetes bacterium]|nr:tRNA pseudouridine(55) synthase TruB [Planctomycetota bacterium]
MNKPAGSTSRQIVDKVARIVHPAKTGHAGTLDPLATGVLVVAVGSATRLISHIQQGRKQYLAEFRLGQRSDTDDVEGRIEEGGDWTGITESALTEALKAYVGDVSQVPPQFSAVHVNGQRAYALARRGETVELQARTVQVHSIQLTRFAPPLLELQIECGSGTYIRSIGRDLGEDLGCGALMTSLRRNAVGPFTLEKSVPFDELNHDRVHAAIQPALEAVANLPRRTMTPEEIVAIRQGRALSLGNIPALESGAEIALVDGTDLLLGIARLESERHRLQPVIVFPAR